MPIQSDGPAPYTAPKAVLTIIEGYRDRGLQTPFTLDVLVKAGVSETLAPRTLQTLKLLDLIDEQGEPTPALVELRKAPSEDFRERFGALLKAAYVEVFSYVNPAEDPPSRVRDAFRSYKPVGQQGRMVTLFLGLCAYAGLIPERVARQPENATQRKPVVRGKSKATAPKTPTRSEESDRPEERATFFAAPPPPAAGHQLIQGLLRELPPIGATWTTEASKAWIELAEGILKVLYKIEDKPPVSSDTVRLDLTPSSKEGAND